MSFSENENQSPRNSCIKEDDHLVKLDELCTRLNTDSYDGLKSKYARQLLKTKGPNKYSRPETIGKNNIFKGRFSKSKDGQWSKKDWDKVFNSRLNVEYIAIRDSQKCLVRGQDIVKGDLLFLRAGQMVPADMRIISYSGKVIVDNRIITGNSAELKSSSPTSPDFLLSQNVIFANTVILNGSCEGIVLKTGDETIFGELTQFATKVKYVSRRHTGSISSLSSGSSSLSIGPNSLPSTFSLSSDDPFTNEGTTNMSL